MKRATLQLTAVELRAVVSALEHALLPGCEWNDVESGADPKEVQAASRALRKLVVARFHASRKGAPNAL